MVADQDKLNLDFVMAANPHSWLLSASNLHGQAVRLRSENGGAFLTYLDKDRRVAGAWDMTNKSVFLLSGFAVENMIKAFLVLEHPHWISNGHLARDLRTHNLNDLEGRSNLIPLKGRYDWVLRELGEGIESWARYPCGLSAATNNVESVMSPGLWDAYKNLTLAYSKELIARLSTDVWRGPHGFEGRWTFSGDFFEF